MVRPLFLVLAIYTLVLAHSSQDDSGNEPPAPGYQEAGSTIEENKKKIVSPFAGSALVAIFAVLAVIGLILTVISLYLRYKKTRAINTNKKAFEGHKKIEKVDAEIREKRPVGREERAKFMLLTEGAGFELDELLKASAEELGNGKFGVCYKATLDTDFAVVVKRLKDLRPFTSEELLRKMNDLASLKHPNLLPLLACYHSGEDKFMVCKFAPNRSLLSRLHEKGGNNRRIPFKWEARLEIAQGVARALTYLHLNVQTHSTPPHGNLKSSNVLLDHNDEALVSDYGYCSLVATHDAAERMAAYKSPEYQYRRKISRKSDVWCYGCILLELLTRKMSCHSAPEGAHGVDLCRWVHRAVREEWTAEIFDVEIAVQKRASRGMVRLLQLALRCCEGEPERRPDMAEVMREVEGINLLESGSIDEEDEDGEEDE